jgi:hypothetical protein
MGINKVNKWRQDLIRDIRTGIDRLDNADSNWQANQDVVQREQPLLDDTECSQENRRLLYEKFMKVQSKCLGIMEIGVCRNGDQSFTHIFLNNKRHSTVYVGIDMNDKSFLDNPDKNIYTIQNTSSDVKSNIEKMKAFGITQLDFIFIDGDHSINQVLIDWEYTQLLSPNGIVALHDVSAHPGPNLFIRNLNPNIWNTEILCPTDHGIGFIWKKQ